MLCCSVSCSGHIMNMPAVGLIQLAPTKVVSGRRRLPATEFGHAHRHRSTQRHAFAGMSATIKKPEASPGERQQ